MLVAYYLEQFNRQYQRQVRRMTPEAVAILQDYDWPGNIRELRNVMERIYVETVGEVIGRRALDEWVQERVLFAPGTWDLEARRARLAQRPALVPPYPADAALSRPLLPYYRDAATAIDVESRAVPGSEYPPAAPDIAPLPRQRGDLLTPERMVWAYHRAGGNMTAAARLLGIHKATLYRHMKTLGLSREDLEARRTTASHLPATSHQRG